MANCKAVGIPAYRLKRYSIESYFSLRALREVFGTQLPASVVALDPDVKLEDQIGLNVKNNHRALAKTMRLAEIDGTDFRAFFDEVRKLCETARPAMD
jgi:hypothetical protein